MADHSASNAKTTLVELCQRYTGRSMGKNDVIYSTVEFDGQYQATVKLDCIEGQEFAGTLCAQPKEAEQAAAHQALEGLRAEIDALAKSGPKRRATAGGVGEAAVPDAAAKGRLKEAVKQLLQRDLTDGDVVYAAESAAGGHKGVVTLPTIPGELGTKTFTGGVSPYKRDTMLLAAAVALDALLQDPEHGPSIDVTKIPDAPEKKDKEKKAAKAPTIGVKGKGKAKAGGWGGEMDWMWESMMAMMGCKGKGKGKAKGSSATGKRKPSGPNLTRERISTVPTTGEVLEWKGKFGWLKPLEGIEHAAASKNQGKVYVNVKDLTGVTSLEPGDMVQFQVYVDSSGLGAEEVASL